METKNFFVLDTSVLFNALYSKILLDLNFTDLISGDVIIPKPALDEIRRNANPLRLKNGDKREKE